MGTGMGTLIPTIPQFTRVENSRAAAAGAGEDGRSVAEGVGVHQREGLVEGAHSHDGEHRSEDLLLVDAHLGLHAVEETAAEVEALALPGDPQPASVDQQAAPSPTPTSRYERTRSRCVARDQRAHLHQASVPGPTRSALTRGASRSTRASATSPTATATEMAMQRSPAEP